jgi:hypothetical protein
LKPIGEEEEEGYLSFLDQVCDLVTPGKKLAQFDAPWLSYNL